MRFAPIRTEVQLEMAALSSNAGSSDGSSCERYKLASSVSVGAWKDTMPRPDSTRNYMPAPLKHADQVLSRRLDCLILQLWNEWQTLQSVIEKVNN
jgi:hypothetical protein